MVGILLRPHFRNLCAAPLARTKKINAVNGGIDLVKDSGIVAWITGESLCRMTGVVWITMPLIPKVILIVFALFLPIG
jgi:hypothetical protein